MIFDWMPVGQMGANCYIIGCEQTKEGAVIDPGEEGRRIVAKAKELGLNIKSIILTHGHIDHIMAVDAVKEATGAQILIHREDAPMLVDGKKNLSYFMGSLKNYSAADVLLKDGDTIKVGNLELKVLHTPGHTPGGICLVVEGKIISGDTLFEGSVGRSDFPGGSHDTLIASIKNKLMAYPDETKVYPGHGPSTTIGFERVNNPFL
ncbi:MAG: MBL fold metallo-hydrolase [Clostridia bacterium]|nr:MBL fold metallo-hydrolase [Clostridia bacterium]